MPAKITKNQNVARQDQAEVKRPPMTDTIAEQFSLMPHV